MRVCLWAQYRKNHFVCLLFVTRACYVHSHFVDSIVEFNLHNVNHILTLFSCCFITYCTTRIFQPVHAAKVFCSIDAMFRQRHLYRVGSNSYRKPYERECISAFMSPNGVLKILKIARAVGLIEPNRPFQLVHFVFPFQTT